MSAPAPAAHGRERPPVTGRRIAFVATMLLSALCTRPVAAAELVVFVLDACAPCALFERQIGRIYARTEEGRRAPLRRVDFEAQTSADLAFLAPAEVAPTFVLVDNGAEIGRFSGYASDELFWLSLNALLNRLPDPAADDR